MATTAAALFDEFTAAFSARDKTAFLGNTVLPCALYRQDEIRVFASAADLGDFIDEMSAAMNAMGVVRTTATVKAETLRCDACCQVWVELNHMNAQQVPVVTEFARFFLIRGADGQLRVAMEEVLDRDDPTLSAIYDDIFDSRPRTQQRDRRIAPGSAARGQTQVPMAGSSENMQGKRQT